ncbi:histidine phosphatase family protein [Paremcibacter congregatus]|uniref:histidine phosphatase family protein n=1 Tax=Paremcibacter congregatus TaxID=2043170 RepID=UPI0030EF5866|tara:strand:- start:6888 stop:7511 length:624 start_codon:yes stop_codon:yes gene_type:complete
MMIRDWYLIRHAPVLGAQEKLYRSGDEPADLSQTAVLDRLAAQLPEQGQWVTSPLLRAIMTARALGDRMPDTVKMREDARLEEQDFGDWFGLSFDELWQKIKDLPPHNWSLLAAETTPAGGESFMAVWQRVGDFLAEQENVEKETPQIIISHAGVIRAIVGHILDMTPDQALSFGCDPLSLTHLQYSDQAHAGGQWRLVVLNQNFGE